MRTISVEHSTPASPEAVWSVLADGWAYPSWVVGASRMRAVEAGFPSPGTKLHHSVGNWPLLLDDETAVRDCEPGKSLRLEAKTRPFGTAIVAIRLIATPDGGTVISMEEDAVSGPLAHTPKPARQVGIAARNRETLRRLALLAERADQA